MNSIQGNINSNMAMRISTYTKIYYTTYGLKQVSVATTQNVPCKIPVWLCTNQPK